MKFSQILEGSDDSIFVIVGPCSIDDPSAALEYARKLSSLQSEVRDELLLGTFHAQKWHADG
jgi:3-deoxy-7-phosphoheptulonate synthase